jgi:hypothetical protein
LNYARRYCSGFRLQVESSGLYLQQAFVEVRSIFRIGKRGPAEDAAMMRPYAPAALALGFAGLCHTRPQKGQIGRLRASFRRSCINSRLSLFLHSAS